MRVILELAGVEKNPEAPRTGFVPDVGLLRIDHPQHPTTAFGAMIIALLVELMAQLGIADVDGFRAVDAFQVLVLASIEPQSATTSTPVDRHLGEIDFFEIAMAFGTVNRLSVVVMGCRRL